MKRFGHYLETGGKSYFELSSIKHTAHTANTPAYLPICRVDFPAAAAAAASKIRPQTDRYRHDHGTFLNYIK